MIATQLTNLAVGIPRYQATIETKIDAARSLTFGKLNDLAGAAGAALQQASLDQRQPAHEAASVSSANQPSPALAVGVREPVPTAFQLVRRVLSPVVSPLETTFIVFIVTIVILPQRDDLRDRAIRLFGSRDLHRTTTAMAEAAHRLSRYFVSQLGVNAGVGVVVGTGLFFIGVPSPILWGILAALWRRVPYVGIWISAILATALAAAVSPGWSMAIWSLTLFLSVELLVGQVVETLLYVHSTVLSPFSVVVAAIFWSWIWGPVGLIPVHTADALRSRSGSPCCAARISRRAARRPARADSNRKFLPASARWRPGRSTGASRNAATRSVALRLLR